MGLFNQSQMDKINDIAKKSQSIEAPKTTKKASSINDELNKAIQALLEYFKDSDAILITSRDKLHDYIDHCIEAKYVALDTETTGLDRSSDYIVGASLYYPGGTQCYIPMKHRVPIFESEYKGQMSSEDVAAEFQRLVDSKDTKLIFANANFDLYMVWKDLKVDLSPRYYYDVILAWRCLKEDEEYNDLKSLYNKYALKGEGDPKKFSDFFSPDLFPYCKPEYAKLYAANDAEITYDLFKWQAPYTIKASKKCQNKHLENIADLIWNVEFPIVPIIQDIEHTGMYIDQDTAKALQAKYHDLYDVEMSILKSMVQEILDKNELPYTNTAPPFSSGENFNPRSTLHVKYLIYDLLKLPKVDGKESTGVQVLSEFNLPITDKIVDIRSLATNISTFIDKLPNAVSRDGKIHSDFKQVGAATGRMSSASPNLQNIPSKLKDVRHMFRAKPAEMEVRTLDISEVPNQIHVTLSYYDSVKMSDGTYRYCKDLKAGDEVVLKKDNVEIVLPIACKVANVGEGDSISTICFEVE